MAKLKKGKSTVTPANNKTDKVVSAQLQKKISKQKAPKEEKGVVFIKNLPHGFYEEQLKRYFRQFGEVTRLRLARSKKTGGSKGYAFIEFEFPEVADYAAEAMNNYLMFQKIVKAQSIPPEKQKYNYFKTKLRKVTNKSGREIYISGEIARKNKQVKRYNDSSDAAYQKRTASAMKTLRKANAKFAALGLDVDIALKPIRADANDSKQEEDECEEQVGSLLLVNKKKSKKTDKIGLKQLLEETIPTDDDDEDYNGENDDDNSSVSSNEMSYGIVDSEDEEEGQGRFVKNMKVDNPVSKLDKLIKKKPLAGGVQKYSKKSLKEDKKIVSAGKTALKKSAVSEIVAQGKVKKMMKAELFKKKGTKKKSS